MITQAQITAIETAAASWLNTPFCEGTPVKGVGCSCQHLVAQVYFESGLLPQVPIPNGATNWGRAESNSPISDWVNGSGFFLSIPLTEAIRPGDLLGFRLTHQIHHLAIRLSRSRIVHAIRGQGVQIPASVPPQWSRRLGAIWRIKDLA